MENYIKENDLLWEHQQRVNEYGSKAQGLIIEQLGNIISIIENHEKDMVKMASKIKKLEKELSELKGSR